MPARQKQGAVLASQEPLKGEAELIDTENVVSETELSIPIDKRSGREDRSGG